MQFVDNLEFALASKVLTVSILLQDLPRARDLLDDLSGEVTCKLIGGKDSQNRPTICIEIYGIISTLCQICLKPISFPANHVWTVTVFDNEVDQMQSLFSEDANCSDGILADTEFDVLSFIEDEIIMLLPISPRHEKCDVQ